MIGYRIRVLNRIAPEGLALFGERFHLSSEEPDPQGILVRSAQVETAAYPSLLAVARAGAGVNNITVAKATEQGICVFNTPGANANAVAELVFVMLGIQARKIHHSLAFSQGLSGLNDLEITARIEGMKSAFKGFELAGKTLGVLGLGKIGVRVANGGIMRRMRVMGFDPFPALENIHSLSSEVSLSRSLDEMLGKAEILSVHIPLSEKTRGMVNDELLSRLPTGAILVNYARGPVVDEQAVLAALADGRLGAYLTDFPSAASLNHPKIIATPHLGASTEESEEQCACMAARELREYLEYGTITHSVNFPIAESMPSGNVHTRFIMINRDIPDMIGFVSHAIGRCGINIASYLNESNGIIGYNIIDLESPIPPELVAEIEAHPGVIRTRVISFRS
jgi:D-3-phosphoglycerate dehydrogenase / 2-oxoglutarate reductase